MLCPFRKKVEYEYSKVGNVVVADSITDSFGGCYEEDCPYYDTYSRFMCVLIDKEQEK